MRKNIIGDVFANAFPAIITAGFMSGYIASLSAANGGGRLPGLPSATSLVERVPRWFSA